MPDSLTVRVVSLQPSVTATFEALGLLDRIVACTRHCPAIVSGIDFSRVVLVDDSWTADAAQIQAARPDIIIASVPYGPESIAQILNAGSRLLAFSPRTLDDIYGDIQVIASLMGVGERGNSVVHRMQQEIESVRSQTKMLPRTRIYCEEWGKPMLTAQPWVAELVRAAGGEFVGTPGSAISADQVAAENPDVIVFGWCGAGDRVPAEKIFSERQWERVSAVRNERAYVVCDQFLTTPAPILTVGLQALAHAIHPEVVARAPKFRGMPVMRTAIPVSLIQTAGRSSNSYDDNQQ